MFDLKKFSVGQLKQDVNNFNKEIHSKYLFLSIKNIFLRIMSLFRFCLPTLYQI